MTRTQANDPKHNELGRVVCTTMLNLEDQQDRLQNIQHILYDARTVFSAIGDGNLQEQQEQAIARLCAFAVETIAEGQAEDAVMDIHRMVKQLTDADAKNEASRQGSAA
jgi:hypothetical protein